MAAEYAAIQVAALPPVLLEPKVQHRRFCPDYISAKVQSHQSSRLFADLFLDDYLSWV